MVANMRYFSVLMCGLLLVSECDAQLQAIAPERPQVPVFIRPYKAPFVPPVRLHNSTRLQSLIRAGKLYLTVQDAIALAIENDLNLEVARYGPLLAEWAVERQEAGGALRGAGGNNAQIGNVASGQGVAGSIASANIGSANLSGGFGGGTNTVVQQIGPVAPNYDPVLTNATTFSHVTTPFANPSIAQTYSDVQITHVYNTKIQQGFETGGFAYIQQNENYLNESAPSDVVNPSEAPRLYAYVQQYLAQGMGTALNTRYIRIAQKNEIASRETFRSQLLDLVANVLNLYWDVVSSNDELTARQRAVAIAEKFNEDTQNEIKIGVLAGVELPRSQAEVAARRQDLLIAQSTLKQREAALKDALVRTQDPAVEAAQIVPLDRIEVPQTDDLPPFRQLVGRALETRPDIAVSKIKDETQEIATLGTTNSLLPTAVASAKAWNAGVAGQPQYFEGEGPNPYFVGGFGTAMGQVFRRNFPNETAGVQIGIPLRNRQSQGDYGIDQLQLRQSALSGQRDNNQIVVNISNQMIALRQARSRYAQAVNTRQLQEELLKAEQAKFSFGTSTISAVIIVQRALVNAQSSEITAAAFYAHARVSLDQVLGQTLEANHVSVDEGLSGRVSKESKLPPGE